jgi:hypothetical protein
MSDEAIVRQLTRSAISRLVEKVMKEEDLPLADALRKVYDSKLFGQVNDPETGLYREGPLFLYGMLCEEQHDAMIAPTHVAG